MGSNVSVSVFFCVVHFGNIIHFNNVHIFLSTIFSYEFTDLARLTAGVVEMYLLFKSAMAAKSYDRSIKQPFTCSHL